MDLRSLKKQIIHEEFGVSDGYGRIFTFIDFGNVNNWFHDDCHNSDDTLLREGERVVIDMEKLKTFLDVFSSDIRFYYGHEPTKQGSMSFLYKTRSVFGKARTFTKPVQWVRHHITEEEIGMNTRSLFSDKNGFYVRLPKCNFDVELAVDVVKLMDKYDTLCLLSSDADFAYLNMYIRSRNKKVILIKGGHITHQLRQSADLCINAQSIKKHIARVMQKPGS